MDQDKFKENSNPYRRLDFEQGLQEEKGFIDLEKSDDDHLKTLEAKIPKSGMEFDSEEAAYEFYNEYAYATGFSIRRTSAHKDNNGKIVDRKFCCSCQGERGQDKRNMNVKSHRPETRSFCPAIMKISARHTSKYKVVAFIAEHIGHGLVSPNKCHRLRSQRKITTEQAAQIDSIEKSGIPPKKGLDYMAQQAGGRENVGFLLEDFRNYLRSKRTIEMKEGDAGGLFHYFQLKQSEDPNFFYAVQVDRDDLIANVFWADAKMKADYAYFGDVVSFDTTYKKNKEGRPFAIFVGVNHHKQSIVFGAALLYDETADTFMWLFDTFQKAMDGKKPETILTDQDAAMAKALEEKWPDTRHRLCIWHIYQNAAVHLSSVFSRFNDFSKDFRSCIYDYEEEEDFIDAWHELLTKYDLKDNEWLKKMFKKKEKWALVYGRQTFCANMTSTQRSESMNSVLKKYVSNKNNLVQFFHNFGKLVDDRRYKEREADLRTNHSTPKLDVEVEILKHARTVYTHEVLKIFQYEFGKAIDSKLEIVYESEGPSQYKITPLGKRYHHTVTFDGMEGKVSCSCRKFEFAGILCSHVLRVFTMKNITTIPELYIKKRWTKKAKKGIVDTFSQSPATSREPSKNTAEENEKIRTQNHYRELCRLFNHLTTRASPIEEGFEFARSQLIKTIEGVDMIWENKANIKSVVEPLQNAVYTLEKNGNVSGEVTVKGWAMKENSRVKSGKRLKSGLEQTTGKRRPKQTKSSTNKSSSDATFENGGRSLNAKDGEVDYVALQTMPHPLIPFSSHIPQINKQNYGVHVQNSSHPQIGLPYAVRGHTFPYMQPSQMMELNTLNVHQQFNHWPQYVEQEQVISHSLTKLLQNQIFQGQDVGMFPLQDSAQENQHQNASKQDGNGHGV